MNDFDYDCYLKKKTATGAKHHKASVHGPKGCKLRTDNMTKKELEKMNGETITYSMNKPINWKTFSSWTVDIKKQYIENIKKTYTVPDRKICEMFGTSSTTYARMLSRINYHSPIGTRCRSFDEDKWNAFLNQDESPVDIPEEQPAAPEPEIIEETIAPEEPIPQSEILEMNFTAILNDWSSLGSILSTIDISAGVKVTINITRVD